LRDRWSACQRLLLVDLATIRTQVKLQAEHLAHSDQSRNRSSLREKLRTLSGKAKKRSVMLVEEPFQRLPETPVMVTAYMSFRVYLIREPLLQIV
jgi:hypothetical protein